MRRRVMLGIGVLALACAAISAAPATTRVTENVTVTHGAVNGVVLRRTGTVLVVYGDPEDRLETADVVLFTHHRRDVAGAGTALAASGARVVIPANEAAHFTDVKTFWAAFVSRRFHDYAQQTTKILTEPIRPTREVKTGDAVEWKGLRFEVLETPGYTRGGVTYFVTVDGTKIAFTGDLIYGDGKLFDWYSLQDEILEAQIRGYHGYAARTPQLLASLTKVVARKPDILIPARGPVIHDPAGAVARLGERLRKAYANYLRIDALRWYFKDEHIRKKARRMLGLRAKIDWMPLAETINEKPPAWIVPFGTSRLIIAADKTGFLVDCGSPAVVKQVKKLKEGGTITGLGGVYITHYHDDHTDQVMEAARVFQCPIYASAVLKDVLENPDAWRLPAMTHAPIRPVIAMAEGQTLGWKEFTLTFSHFPGQTLYHGGLLVEKAGEERIFFIGDSFTPSGIDDYCQLNRNLLHPGEGFLRCLQVLRRMEPDYLLINEHVGPTWRYSREQLDFMTATLEERIELLRELFPWDDPNYGIDEGWARFYPYGQTVEPGTARPLRIRIRNHSPSGRRASVRLRLPDGWQAEPREASLRIRGSQLGEARFEVTAPVGTRPGVYVVTADLTYGDRELREWTEALFVCPEKNK